MNQTKRTLELIASVISIILGAFLALGSIVLLSGVAGLEESGYIDPATNNIMQVTTIIVLLGSIAIIIVASILASSPMKRGIIRERFGLQLTLAIFVGVVAIFELLGDAVAWFLIFLAPLVLLIISMCLKHPANIPAPTQSSVNSVEVENVETKKE